MSKASAAEEAAIFLDGEEVTAFIVSFWPDDGVIEVVEDGKVVRKRGRVEVRRVAKDKECEQ